MKSITISRIFRQRSNKFNYNVPIITQFSSISTLTNTSALSKSDKKKLISQHRLISKSEYERAAIIRSKMNKKVKKELEDGKSEHHAIFQRICYQPSFPEKYEPTDISLLNPSPASRPKPYHRERCGLIAQKIGMTTMFDSKGVYHPITILKVNCCQVLYYKSLQNRRKGTFNLQLGAGTKKISDISWRNLGHFNAHNISPKEKLTEFPCGHEALIKPGTELTCRHFLVGQFVDIQGVSRDQGFQGCMKRWGFKGGPATHGSSKFHRKRGSMGGNMANDHGNIFKGKRMPGHMGNKKYTQHNLRIFRIEPKQNLIYIRGHVPGYFDKWIKIRDSHFKPPLNPPFPTFIPDPNETELPEYEQWDGDVKNRLWNRDPNPDDWLDDRVTHDLL